MRGALVALFVAATACSPSGQLVEGSLQAAIDAAAAGDVLRLSGELEYRGPLTIDRPLSIIGNGARIVSADDVAPTLLITSDAVRITDVVVVGGSSGIDVRDSSDVEISGVVVRGARWHGIFAHDAQITVEDCRVAELTEPLAQGIEIINSDSRPASLVRGCVVEGPVYEGIVSHVSHVVFEDNVVVGSTQRGIAVTEMSEGRIEGNVVSDATGNAFYCGDMSRCSVVDNAAERVAGGADGFRSGAGHGLVVHYHSRAFVDDLRASGIGGDDIVLMIGSELATDSLYP